MKLPAAIAAIGPEGHVRALRDQERVLFGRETRLPDAGAQFRAQAAVAGWAWWWLFVMRWKY
jgi:hypothetical protein